MGIMDYFKGKKQLKTKEVKTETKKENKTVSSMKKMRKVQNFLTKTKRLELGQEPYFNEATLNLITEHYKEYRASLERQQTVSDEVYTTDMYDLYTFYKDKYQEVYNNHCEEYAKLVKTRGLTEEQLEKIESAFIDLRGVYFKNLQRIPTTSEKGAEKK